MLRDHVGRSKQVGFVQFTNAEEVESCIQAMHGKVSDPSSGKDFCEESLRPFLYLELPNALRMYVLQMIVLTVSAISALASLKQRSKGLVGLACLSGSALDCQSHQLAFSRNDADS